MNEPRIRCMVADDEEGTRVLLSMILEALRQDVVAQSEDGEQTLQLFRDHRPDILFLDYYLPDLNGKMVLKRILSDYPNACVVMLSGGVEPSVIDDCLIAGAFAWIQKGRPAVDMKKMVADLIAKYMVVFAKEVS
ncbi:MAG: response regulator [Magnetococcus sp. DMHC-6]